MALDSGSSQQRLDAIAIRVVRTETLGGRLSQMVSLCLAPCRFVNGELRGVMVRGQVGYRELSLLVTRRTNMVCRASGCEFSIRDMAELSPSGHIEWATPETLTQLRRCLER